MHWTGRTASFSPRFLCFAGSLLWLLFSTSARAQDTPDSGPDLPLPPARVVPVPVPPAPTLPLPEKNAAPQNPSPTPVNPAANPADINGFVFERRRIRRTVPLDPASGLERVWDRLYVAGNTPAERRAVYLNWDSDFLYLAAESPAAETVRFDIDGADDGWFRGADNLRITTRPAATAPNAVTLEANRWDTIQNRERPVWASSPIPVETMRAVAGTTSGGTRAVLLAIPRTEQIGLPLRDGARFGLRVDFGETGDPVEGGATAAIARPMLRLELARSQPATEQNLRIEVGVKPEEIVPGDSVAASLSVTNTGAEPVRVARFFLRGSASSFPLLDAVTFTGRTLQPGETVRRSLNSTVAPWAGLGALVVAGGVELSTGETVAALASLQRVDPYSATLQIEERAVLLSGNPERRTALLTLRSRTAQRSVAKIEVQVPDGWIVEGGKQRELPLTFAGEQRGIYLKIVVPAGTATGVYPIRARVRINDRSYLVEEQVPVTRSALTR